MAARDPRIDAYIAKSAEFARPILEHLRATVHAACPEVEETLKWSSPHFNIPCAPALRHVRVQAARGIRFPVRQTRRVHGQGR